MTTAPLPGQPTPAPTPTDNAPPHPDTPLDLVGIGIGPFNLSLAALAHPLTNLTCAFYEQRRTFAWHPGLMIEGASLQVPFLADLVTLADPASPWTFLNYLKTRERLYPFYFAERFHIQRAEYDAYCRWVSENLPNLHFRHHIDAIRWNEERTAFEIDYTQLDPEGEAEALGRAYAHNLVLGIGTAPHIPEPLKPLTDAPDVPVIHSADYLDHRERLLATEHITVIGSGQSGAEVFLDLLRHRPTGHEGLHWLARTPAFAPMEYSKLGLEHFTPDYTGYFHALPEATRDTLVPQQWQLHKGIDHDTIAAIYEELYNRTLHGGWPDAVLTPGVTIRTAGRIGTAKIELHLEHSQQETRSRLTTDAVVLATGYRERDLTPLIGALDPYLRRDRSERPRVDAQHRLDLDPHITGSIYVQNAERHTHGVGTPDLGLAAWRSAVILNSLTDDTPYPLPTRTAFTTFGLTPPARGQRHLPTHRAQSTTSTSTSTRPTTAPNTPPHDRHSPPRQLPVH